MFTYIVLIIASIGNLLLGLLVLLKNPKVNTNKSFFAFTLSFTTWAIVNQISLNPFLFSQLYWARLVLFFAAILCFALATTFNFFPGDKLYAPRYQKFITWALLPTLLFTISPYTFKSLEYQVDGSPQPVIGFGIMFFLVYVLSTIAASVVFLIKRTIKATGYLKTQLLYTIFGIVSSFSLVLIFNFFFVAFLKNQSGNSLAPLFILIFNLFFSYAIIKHHLFDIRPIVARSLAYVLSVFFIAVAYAALVLSTSGLIFQGSSTSTSQKVVYLILAVIASVFFQPIKNQFDKVTNSLFYRDAYNPQAFIDRLNKAMVADIEIYSLLGKVSKVIETDLKVTHCTFVVIDQNDTVSLVGGTQLDQSDKTKANLKKLIQSAETLDSAVVTDYLDDSQYSLKQKLARSEIGAIFNLNKGKVSSDEFYILSMVLGIKKSGNPYSRQDVTILNIATNELVLAAQNALRFEEISRFNITLQQKIDDATKELRRTNEKLKALDEAKDEFISMASHQLRTPLTSVKGYLSMVLEGDTGKVVPKQKQLLQQAYDSSQRMVFLIADLLNVSRLHTGKFVIENKATNLAEVVETEVAQLSESAAARGQKLIYDKPGHFPTLMLDETKVRQVVMNFLDNAIYYTPNGGHITAKLTASKDMIQFTVLDTGVGVPKSEQHHLFSKFYRAGNAKKMRPDGTGLGLFMAKKVIIAQGGAVVFKSIEGKGSTFGFSFPRKSLEVKH